MFEHFIALELRAYLAYHRLHLPLQYWRSTSHFEVDFIIGTQWALEIKSCTLILDKHLAGIRALKEEGLIAQYGVVSFDPVERITPDGIVIWPWKVFLEKLWSGRLGFKSSI